MSICGFREGESHAPTPKPALIFLIELGLYKDHLPLMSVEGNRRQTGGGQYHLANLFLFLGHSLLMRSPLSLDVQWSLDFLVGCFYSPGKVKTKPFPTLNMGGGFFLSTLYLS